MEEYRASYGRVLCCSKWHDRVKQCRIMLAVPGQTLPSGPGTLQSRAQASTAPVPPGTVSKAQGAPPSASPDVASGPLASGSGGHDSSLASVDQLLRRLERQDQQIQVLTAQVAMAEPPWKAPARFPSDLYRDRAPPLPFPTPPTLSQVPVYSMTPNQEATEEETPTITDDWTMEDHSQQMEQFGFHP